MISILSFVWLLSLAFYKFSIVGSLSFDNLLTPVLFLIVAVAILTRVIVLTPAQIKNILWAGVTIFAYFISHTFNLLTTESAVWASMTTIAKGVLYFILPVIFINTEKQLKLANNAMIIVMLVGCLTALMQSVGILQLEFARHAFARFELEGFEKTVGFLGSYGDVGMLTSLAVLLVFGGRKDRVLWGRGSWLKIFVIVAAALAGIVAQQSRNLVFTVLVSVLAFIFLGYIRERASWRGLFYFVLIFGIGLSTLAVALFSDDLITWVQSIGGTREAAATVEARLSQYAFGWSVVHDHLLVGADPAVLQSNQTLVSFIHNMWLKELVEGGVPAVLATLWFFIRAVRNQVSRYHYAPENYAARAYLALLVGALVATQFYPASTYIYWVLLGIATARPAMEQATSRAIPARSQGFEQERALGVAQSARFGGYG